MKIWIYATIRDFIYLSLNSNGIEYGIENLDKNMSEQVPYGDTDVASAANTFKRGDKYHW